MIKILIPQDKSKTKTEARGFWHNDNGRVYYDYLTIQNYKDNNNGGLFTHLESIKKFYRQEAIFYVKDKIGFCYYGRDKITILPHRIYKEVLRQDLKVAIKEALSKFSGCTIYREAGRYYIEVFTTL